MEGFSKERNKKEKVLGFEREDLSGMIQRARGKENIWYKNADGREFFSKIVTFQEGTRDNLRGLRNEKYFLDLLADSGVTPRKSDLKVYPNEKRARLNIEAVPGVSLDKMTRTQKEEIWGTDPEAVIMSTAKALEKIHKQDTLLVDVNEGSFLLEKQANEVSTHIVDFELATDLKFGSAEDREAAFKWYQGKDVALRTSDSIDHQDPNTLRKAEIRLWAKTLVEQMTGTVLRPVDMTQEKQVQFDSVKEVVSPVLEREIRERAKKDYAFLSNIPPEKRFGKLEEENEFIENQLSLDLPRRIEEELIGVTLEERLEQKGIGLSAQTLNFLSRALSIDISSRPSHFEELDTGM